MLFSGGTVFQGMKGLARGIGASSLQSDRCCSGDRVSMPGTPGHLRLAINEVHMSIWARPLAVQMHTKLWAEGPATFRASHLVPSSWFWLLCLLGSQAPPCTQDAVAEQYV
ncbi:unnamed protein product [Polarella glacialis]|uniref:Uncharacterized protein n=1 Tax=Polarella glacialis TaxID=89957 RepID=A0A813LRD8_POLGL|nr:unnamed protein product [Polarella glacialis]